MTDRQKLVATILGAIPALLLACTAWVQADAARKARSSEAGLGDNYQSYVEDRMARDEALIREINELRLRLAYCDLPDGIRAQIAVEPTDLDALAAQGGYRFKKEK
jgi:hypothetical protein